MTYAEKRDELYNQAIEQFKLYMQASADLYKDHENRTVLMWSIHRHKKLWQAAEEILFDFNLEFSKSEELPTDQIKIFEEKTDPVQ